MRTLKDFFNALAWIISVPFQCIVGLIVGYIAFAEGYGNIIFMWLGIVLGIFVIGVAGTIFRKEITPKKYFSRLGLTALGAMFPLLIFYFAGDFFFYNADYETPLEFPFLATIVGIVGFYIPDLLLEKSNQYKKIRVVSYFLSIVVLVTGAYAIWDWRTPVALPIQNIKPNEAFNLELVNIVGNGMSIDAIRSNFVYGISNERLVVFDISDHKNLLFIGQSEIIPGDLLRINLYENYAYITSGKFGIDPENRIHVVDISDPTNPHYLASYDLSGKYIWDVKIFGSYLYTIGCIECTQYSWDQHAIYIMDLQNPSRPKEVGYYYSDFNISDFSIRGNTAYLSLDEEDVDHPGLVILDISNLKEPNKVNSLFPSEKGYLVTISGDRLYYYGISRELSNGLHIMDISNSRNPKEISFHPHAGYDDLGILPENIGFTTKSIPCICDTSNDGPPNTRLTFIDYSNPKYPIERGSLEFGGYFADVQDSVTFAWDSEKKAYRFFDVTNLDNPVEIASYSDPIFTLFDLTGEIFIEGNKGVIPTDANDLYILDFSNPSSPTLSSVYNVGDSYSILGLQKGFAYVFTADGIQVLDLSLATSPNVIWKYDSYDKNGQPSRLVIEGRYAYYINEIDGLSVFDNTNPGDPLLLSRWPDLKEYNFFDSFDVSGRYLYIFNNDGIHVFDVNNPTEISEIGNVGMQLYQDVTVIGNFAFLDDSPYSGNEPATISIVNLTNPAKPKLSGSYHWSQWSRINGRSEDLVLIADWSDGVHIVDFSDPKKPKEIGFYGIKDGAGGAALGEDNFIYVISEYDAALYVLRYTP